MKYYELSATLDVAKGIEADTLFTMTEIIKGIVISYRVTVENGT